MHVQVHFGNGVSLLNARTRLHEKPLLLLQTLYNRVRPLDYFGCPVFAPDHAVLLRDHWCLVEFMNESWR